MSETRNATGVDWLTVGNVDCRTLKDGHFNLIRQVCGISDEFLKDTFDYGQLSSGGGKGGESLTQLSKVDQHVSRDDEVEARSA